MIESRTQLEQGFRPGFAPVNEAGRAGISIPATHRIDQSGRIRLDDLPSAEFAQETKWFPTSTSYASPVDQITLAVNPMYFWRTLWLGFPSVILDANVYALAGGSLLGFLEGKQTYEQKFYFNSQGVVPVYGSTEYVERQGASPSFSMQGSVTSYPSPTAISAYQVGDQAGPDDLSYAFSAVIPTTPNVMFIGQAIMKPFRICAAFDRLVVRTTLVTLASLAAAGLILACRSQNTPH